MSAFVVVVAAAFQVLTLVTLGSVNSSHSTVSSQATVCLPLKEYMDQTANNTPGQKGMAGKAGPMGDMGDPGQKGEKGDQGQRAIQGMAGKAGPKGDMGDPGQKGVKGDQGQRAIQNEVAYYFMSPTWLAAHAQFFETPTKETGRLIFGRGTKDNNRLFKVPLALPGSLSDSATYILNVKVWRVPLSSDCDTHLAICDRDNCYGFMLAEQGGVYSSQWQSSSTTCSYSNPLTSWHGQHVWDFRFELSPSHTLAMAWSGTSNKGQYKEYNAMTASGGLWMTVCRNEADESQEIRFVEVSVKTA